MEDDHILLPPSRPQARSSCSRGTAYTVFSLLGALLLAGQAVTVYFVYQHDNQINKLTKNTQQLKLDSLIGSISKNVRSGPKMAIANVMPLALNEPEFLLMENKLTNSTEDQVKRLLLRENPTRTFPELKSNFLENMGQLKIHMAYNDWKEFETWMHKWLIFQMAQKQDTEGKTKCQKEECVKGVHPGRFCAHCDEKGNYLPMQCLPSSGYCWCVYNNGTKIEGSSILGRPDCDGIAGPTEPVRPTHHSPETKNPQGGILDPENVTYSGDQN
ncbi:HLA class II histocompatibility antigen gamma chain isoform X1 [Protobothrops mucrosquamatus]|uniref:HLA class II histocompatibility antigen gamma chain isoform X1 n=1 Tax=Protobothrops mucrosquamatus TaxID=103944 RepID=UPI000775F102|nr:HLA class II histocompatibility antigen gamma chain isoform X1 [Protobothrops mucrosquamatus]